MHVLLVKRFKMSLLVFQCECGKRIGSAMERRLREGSDEDDRGWGEILAEHKKHRAQVGCSDLDVRRSQFERMEIDL